ncbi:MAG TPA: helix-turn-helix domain-containing protein [Pseudomonadota bacterium]|nr:helix-turn-helix domain-containing protein [Pseudomonadota bacterium]
MVAKSRFPKGDLSVAACPSRTVLDHVTSRWGALLLVVLQERTHRFSELRQRIDGVSEKMLAQSLRVLEDDGFVQRTAFAEVPPRVEYSLTAMGREIAALMQGLHTWIEGNLPRVLDARARHARKKA